MKQALLIIDYSNDFVDNHGALTCGEAGQALDAALLAQLEQSLAAGDFVFVCNDEHNLNDEFNPESHLFPPHNLLGSWGVELYGQTGLRLRELLATRHPLVNYLPKQRYSAFFGTPLFSMLRARRIEKLVITGVCTDICVLHTAIDAIYNGFAVKVPADCCATIIEGGQQWALNHLRSCLGVEVE